MNSQAAAGAFSESRFAESLKYTEMGAEGDATSLENMKKALEWTKECNEIRTTVQKSGLLGSTEELEALTVSDYIMATSQIMANRANYNVSHSDETVFSENLAWGWEDPFDGWYYEELEIYKQRLAESEDGKIYDLSGIGHLINMCCGNGFSTGFGVCTKPGGGENHFGTAFCQEFGLYDGDTNYTLEEYAERFNTYYNKYVNAPQVTAEAKAALEAAQTELTAAQNTVDEKTKAADKAATTLTEMETAQKKASDQLTKAEDDYKKATADTSTKQANLENALAAQKSAQKALESAKTEAKTAQKNVSLKKEAVDATTTELNSAKETASKKEASLDSAKATYKKSCRKRC